MEYVMAKISFLGNDDVSFEGFVARKVESLEEWKKQIEAQLDIEFDGSGFMDIYHSDNCSTPFGSKEEILDTITFTKISEQEFKTLSKLLANGNDEKVEYGNTVSFMEYEDPNPKPAKKMKR